MRAERAAVVMGGAALALLLGGCLAVPGAIDGPIAVNLHVSTTPTTVEVDAPGWFAETTAIYLCHEQPPPLPEAAADRIGWTPGGACHDYGTRPSRDGLKVSLPLTDVAGETWAPFAAANEWYLLLLDLDGNRVSAAVRSRFGAPDIVAPF